MTRAILVESWSAMRAKVACSELRAFVALRDVTVASRPAATRRPFASSSSQVSS